MAEIFKIWKYSVTIYFMVLQIKTDKTATLTTDLVFFITGHARHTFPRSTRSLLSATNKKNLILVDFIKIKHASSILIVSSKFPGTMLDKCRSFHSRKPGFLFTITKTNITNNKCWCYYSPFNILIPLNAHSVYMKFSLIWLQK